MILKKTDKITQSKINAYGKIKANKKWPEDAPHPAGQSNQSLENYTIYQLITKYKDMLIYKKNVPYLQHIRIWTRKCLSIMKYSLFFIMMGTLQAIASVSYSQTVKFTLDMQDATVAQVISRIENSSQFYFTYNTREINPNRKVSVHLEETDINAVIKQLFAGENVNYIVADKHVVLYKDSENMLKGNAQQGMTVVGVVTDDIGETMPGVNVMVKGSTTGVITDINGKYTIAVPHGNVTLVFSFMGYVTQEIEVGNRFTIDVMMPEDTKQISEVVITALGIKREKRSLGYAQESVKGEAFIQAMAPNVTNALSGKIAGVIIPQTNGFEGGSTRIIIRGNNSIDPSKNNQPLYVIDGVPTTNESGMTSSGGGRDWGSSANDINPYDIEEMSILKGPAAAALYGARGANGAVLITTKKGSKRPGLGVDFGYRVTSTSFYRYGDYQNQYGLGESSANRDWGISQLQKNSSGQLVLPSVNYYGSGASWGAEMKGQDMLWWDGQIRQFTPQPENFKEPWQTGVSQMYNLAFSGGGDKGTIRVSATYYDLKGQRPNTDGKRTTLNLGAHLDVSKKISTDVNISYFDHLYRNAPELGDGDNSQKNWIWTWDRSYKIDLEKDIWHRADGSRNTDGWPQSGGLGRPGAYYWNMYTADDNHYRKRLLGSIALNYNIVDWLTARMMLGMDNTNSENKRYTRPTDEAGFEGRYGSAMGRNLEYNHEIRLTATKENILPDINATASIGGVYYKRDYYLMDGGTDTNFSSPYIYILRNYDANNSNFRNNIPDESFFRKEIQSIHGYINLSYKNFIYLDLTGRNDWSSTLPANSNSYFYPSVSGSFVFTDAFQMDSQVLNYGKIRISRATAATDEAPFLLNPVFSSGTYSTATYNRLPGAIPSKDLKPQTTKSWEFGTNLGFFKDRILLELTYFNSNTTNQILGSPLPWSSGTTSMRINEGKVQTKGFEFMINAIPIHSRDFRWDITLTGTRSINKLISLSEGAEKVNIDGIFGQQGPSVDVKPGEKYGVIYGWDYERDANGNKIVAADGSRWKTSPTKVPVGNSFPDLTGGINNQLSYKNFSLNVFIDASIGGDMWYGSYIAMMGYGMGANTVKERNGGGLPYVIPANANATGNPNEGTTQNIGVILDGMREVQDASGNVTGYTPNDIVVHYTRYYDTFQAWGQSPTVEGVFDNTWVRMREISLTYRLDSKILGKIKFIQDASIQLTAQNLFYLYDNAPLKLNPGASNGSGNSYGIEFGGLPVSRSFGLNVRLSF